MTSKTGCLWCGSLDIRKYGIRNTRHKIKQVYFCNSCKHKFTGEVITPKTVSEVHEPMPRFTYSQNWEAYNKAQTEEGRLFRQILYELTTIAETKRKRTGRPRHELRNLIFAACLKMYTGLSSRRLISELGYAHTMDYISEVPHFNTVLNALASEETTEILQELIRLSSTPAKMLEDTYAADSTGFSTSMFGRWFDKKFGKDEIERVWVKAHAMIGTRTNTITSIEVTPANKGDSPQFIPLLEKTKENAKIIDVVADKAYSSRANLEAVVKVGAYPYIPFRSNTTGKASGSTVWKNVYNFFILHNDEFMDHYHQRSNIESTFSMIKRKFGGTLRSKSFSGMKNEILARAVVHNICCLISGIFEFGVSPEQIWGKPKEPAIPDKDQLCKLQPLLCSP